MATVDLTTPEINPLRQGSSLLRTPDPCTLVIFGATGDLNRRKLTPALYNLGLEHLMPNHFNVIGFSRQEMSDEDYRKRLLDAMNSFASTKPAPAIWESFQQNFFYLSSNFDELEGYQKLSELMEKLDKERGTVGNRLFYLSTPPTYYSKIIEYLGEVGLGGRDSKSGGWSRIVVEKPFGRDLETARQLNLEVNSVFKEEQVYRIDHYLGKETVQNILTFRFGNGIFEPLWNRRYIDHVQITMAEEIGIEGRGSYYDESGAIRDMLQNHLMQLLTLVAMEPPVAYNADAIRDEKVKVLHAIQPFTPQEVATHVVRGQYGNGWVGGQPVEEYRTERNVAKDSNTETFVAAKFFVENWRWAGVPFYLRTGKRVPKRITEIGVQFKRAPLMLFRKMLQNQQLEPNWLTLRIQPDEGISLRFTAKVPGLSLQLRSVNMDFFYGASFATESADAYERLLLDAMLGEPTLFTRRDEIEASWELVTAILKGWQQAPAPNFPNYQAGTWGPSEASKLMDRYGRRWRRL